MQLRFGWKKYGERRGGLHAKLEQVPHRPPLPSLLLANVHSLMKKTGKTAALLSPPPACLNCSHQWKSIGGPRKAQTTAKRGLQPVSVNAYYNMYNVEGTNGYGASLTMPHINLGSIIWLVAWMNVRSTAAMFEFHCAMNCGIGMALKDTPKLVTVGGAFEFHNFMLHNWPSNVPRSFLNRKL